MMRIADVLYQSLDGIDRLVDLHEGELDLASYLNLPEGVEYVRAPGTPADALVLDARSLLLDLYGPDPRRHRPLDLMAGILGALEPGRRAVVLFGFEEGELPVHRVVDALRESPCRIDAVIPLGYQHITTAVVLERVGEADVAEHNLLRLTDYGARTIRARVHALEAQLERARAGIEPGTVDDDTSPDDKGRNELRELRAEVEVLRKERDRLMGVEQSTTYQVGRVVIDALAKPGKRTMQAPKDLARLWKRRGNAPKIGEGPAASANVNTPAPVLRTDRLLVPFPAAVDTDLSGVLTVGGVWTAEAERVLAPDCRVVTLHPNQAATQLRRTDPDLLLVQSSAAASGSAWAALGTPPGLARDRELAALLEQAAEREIPTVLWYDRPPYVTPGLDALADRFDLVLTDHGPWADTDRPDAFSLGVQLERYGALEAVADVERVPAFFGALDPRLGHRSHGRLESVLRAAITHGLRAFDDSSTDELAGDPPAFPTDFGSARAGYLPSTKRPATYRRHPVWVAMPPLRPASLHTRTLEQLAAGARVVVPHAIDVEGELKHRVFEANADADHALYAALEATGDGAQFVVVRELYLRASTGQWLSRLARQLSRDVDPRVARATTLVLADVDVASAPALAQSVLAQRERPAHVVASVANGAAATVGVGLSPLERSSIRVDVVEGDAGLAVASATTPFVAIAPTGDGGDQLLDLHVVQACTGASLAAIGDRALVRTDAVRRGDVTLTQRDGAYRWDAPAIITAAVPA